MLGPTTRTRRLESPDHLILWLDGSSRTVWNANFCRPMSHVLSSRHDATASQSWLRDHRQYPPLAADVWPSRFNAPPRGVRRRTTVCVSGRTPARCRGHRASARQPVRRGGLNSDVGQVMSLSLVPIAMRGPRSPNRQDSDLPTRQDLLTGDSLDDRRSCATAGCRFQHPRPPGIASANCRRAASFVGGASCGLHPTILSPWRQRDSTPDA